MKYKIGEKIRVKTFEEIKKTFDEGNRLKGEILFFNNRMKVHCGKTYEIDSYSSTGPYYYLKDCKKDYKKDASHFWAWPEEWLEPIKRFEVGDFVSINPKLKVGQVVDYHTVYSGMMADKNPSTLKIIEKTSDSSYKLSNGYYYPEEMLIPITDFARITTVLKSFSGVDFDLDNKEYNIKITESPYKEQFNTLKNKIYEHQLQREKARIRGAEIPTGRRICRRKRKAAVIIGHLSNQARAGY